jgi:hypothetical protein
LQDLLKEELGVGRLSTEKSEALLICQQILDLEKGQPEQIKTQAVDYCRRIITKNLGSPEIFAGEVLDCIKDAERQFQMDFLTEGIQKIVEAVVKISKRHPR